MIDIREIDLAAASPDDLGRLLRRSAVPDAAVRKGAADIVDAVRSGGDAALRDAGKRFGGRRADAQLAIPAQELANALTQLDPATREALENAAANIRAAHEPQRPVDQPLEVSPGVRVDRRWSPLDRVGVYVPGGSAAYPSSLLMGVIPAQVAGVADIAVASPADGNGRHSQVLLAAAALLGVTEVYAVGGAQAVAALAYGTERIPRVDKIVGPGNAWVTAAKLVVYGDCAVDLPAGPSEALVVADDASDPRIVAADMLCQAEHGPDSPVVLITTDGELAGLVRREIDALLPSLERAAILRQALTNHGAIITAPTAGDVVRFANGFAPEHCSIHTTDPEAMANAITAAGSVFVGHWSPESAGDYATGANHVLPTGGLARSYGPLSVEDFGSWRQVQQLTRDGLASLRTTIGALAEAEGLTAHKLAVEIRFENDS